DHVICVCMNEPGLEFVWVGDDAIDPLEQAQTLQILVGAGIKTREEARADLGLAPAGGGPGKPQAKLGKYNPHHDERGLFATADGAVATVGSVARKPRPTAVQVASSDAMMSDVGGLDVAQIIEPEPPPPEPEALRPAESAPAAPTGTVAEAVLRNGGLPGVADKLGAPRAMPASDDPDSAARAFVLKAYNGQKPSSLTPLGDGGFIAQMPDGAYITFRPAGQASSRTPASTANVDINDAKIKQLNGGEFLKLKFPKK
ncbi:MAG: hypothetical protein WA397_29715, partial [Roseiarcus sp.]